MIRRMSCSMPTNVMEPTIRQGATIVVDAQHYDHNKPQRWDIIVFAAPELEDLGEQLGQARPTAAKSGKSANAAISGRLANAAADLFEKERILVRPHIFYVKRILGLPGEAVKFDKGAVSVNGRAVPVPSDLKSLYGKFEGFAKARFGAAQEYKVAEDRLYVLSDNIAAGRDSREIGAIPMAHVIGRVVM